VLRVEQAPTPVPGPGELLIRTEAIGVTLPVVRKVREGGLPLPASLGGEITGEVIATGPDVTGVQVGDLVTGLCFADGYADVGVLQIAPAPDGPCAHPGCREGNRQARPPRQARHRKVGRNLPASAGRALQ
jgi:NADPH2:quinone reductase